MSTISIVVPLHNEEESLPLLVKAIDDVFSKSDDSYEIIFIDDGSTDKSFSILETLYSQYGKKIRIIRFTRNYGKSAALSVGIKAASGEIIITM
ncbi:MAG: glycosyltransferase, partial [Fibrobacter sp.]|nr:glycosyltransferase [Fibrobacter sp.]